VKEEDMKKIMVVLFFAVMLVISCGGGLTDKQTEEMLEKFFLANGVPREWNNNYMESKLKSIKVSVIRKDKSIKKQNNGQLPFPLNADYKDCWPVEVFIRGEMRISMQKFEKNANILLCKTYQGDNWNIAKYD
jgi:hypothetical protein